MVVFGGSGSRDGGHENNHISVMVVVVVEVPAVVAVVDVQMILPRGA